MTAGRKRTHRARRRYRALRDDTGSMPLALLVTTIGVLLSGVLGSITVDQIAGTRVESRRVGSLHAAQAGIDVAVAHIRAASADGVGVRAKLPCAAPTNPLRGVVDAAGRYEVTIAYYLEDPVDEPAQAPLACFPETGPVLPPRFAAITATGADVPPGGSTAAAHRTLTATYTFRTTNEVSPGGQIRAYRTATSPDLCFDAGSGAPALPVRLVMQPCVTGGSAQQTFAYTPDLQLVLVPSKATTPAGMCVDGGLVHQNGTAVMLQPCITAAAGRWRQQWSFNSSTNFEGTTVDGTHTDGFCLNVERPGDPGSPVVLGGPGSGGLFGCHKPHNIAITFVPDAAAGAGAAGPDDDAARAAGGTQQVVNFGQFGRCIDLTNYDTTPDFLIVWPCKQQPVPTGSDWNQYWRLPAIDGTSGTGHIATTGAGTHWCLNSPLARADPTAAGGPYVLVSECQAGRLDQTWTRTVNTGDYGTSYVIRDGAGYCLAPTDATVDRFQANISKLVVLSCDGSALQKWNAPPQILSPLPLKDIRED